MSRTEIAIEPAALQDGANAMLLKLVRAPVNIANPTDWRPFTCNPSTLPALAQPNPAAVRQYGQTILGHLNQHPGVMEALQAAMAIPPGQRCPIYFRVEVGQPERVYWETICDAAGHFLALDRRWPVGRVAESRIAQESRWHTFSPPLRLMALISAAGVDATPEWQGLAGAIAQARNAGIGVEALVFVGQTALHDAIQAQIQNGTLQGVQVRPMPDRRAAIEDVIVSWRPHILHFFCHGHSGHGVAQLQLATFADELQAKAAGSTVIHLTDLEAIAARRDIDIWLVVLNCCMGAQAVDGLPSMARTLVSAGVPAVVAMAEPVAAADAHEFTGSFAPMLLGSLAQRLAAAQPNVPVEVEWADLLSSPRVALRDLHGEPSDHRYWALPVLYVRTEPFAVAMVAGGGMAEDKRRRVDMIAGLLRSLPQDTPAEARAEFLALLNDVPLALRPNAMGTFD
jgi:hypothetical protein